MLKMNKVSFIRVINISLVSVFLMASAGQAIAAKGSGGGRTFDMAYSLNGACTRNGVAVDALPRIVLRSSQGAIYYILETIGTASAGTWVVTFTTQFKAGDSPSSVSTTWRDLPQGWAVTGGQVPGGAKFTNIGVESTNNATGVSCTATLNRPL